MKRDPSCAALEGAQLIDWPKLSASAGQSINERRGDSPAVSRSIRRLAYDGCYMGADEIPAGGLDSICTHDTATLRRLLHGPGPAHKAAAKLQRFRTGPTSYEVTTRPYCDAPVGVRLFSKAGGLVAPATVEMLAPCRECAKCMYMRQQIWRTRIENELRDASRTWFVVLTFSPLLYAGVRAEAYRASGNRPSEAQFERAAYGHVQKFLKRLRKHGGVFRYYAVPEHGELHGRLHYHILIHETLSGSVQKRLLERCWRGSNIFARLCDTQYARAAAYVSKYVSKSRLRVRASKRYGSKVNLIGHNKVRRGFDRVNIAKDMTSNSKGTSEQQWSKAERRRGVELCVGIHRKEDFGSRERPPSALSPQRSQSAPRQGP